MYSLKICYFSVCPLSFVRLPSLKANSEISCSVPDYCTGIDCCLDITNLELSIRAYLDINLCTYIVSGGIENEEFSFPLFKYEWGICCFFTVTLAFNL